MMKIATEKFKRLILPKLILTVAIVAFIFSGGVFTLLTDAGAGRFTANAEAAALDPRVFDPDEDVLYKDGDDNILYRFAYGSGNGTAERFNGETDDDGIPVGPYLLATAAHLDNIRNVDTYTDMLYFKLVADIDLGDYLAPGGDGYKQDGWGDAGWKPIKTVDSYGNNQYFCSTLDGGGYEIRNLWMNRPEEDDTVGLFDVVAGVFVDLKIVLDPQKGIVGGDYTGALAGSAGYAELADPSIEAAIRGCSVTGRLANINNDSQIKYCGGLFGDAKSLTIAECYFEGEISGVFEDESWSEFRGLGGIAGASMGVIYRNCYSKIRFGISGGITESEYTGGLVGGYKGAEKFENCYSVITGQSKAKPFAGEMSVFFGQKNPPSYTVQACYYMGEAARDYTEDEDAVEDEDEADNGRNAVRLSIEDAQKSASYKIDADTLWNFTTVWGIFEGEGLPYLKAFGNAVLLTPVSGSDVYDGNAKTPDDIAIIGGYDEGRPIAIEGIATLDVEMTNAGGYTVAVAYQTTHAYQVTVAKYSIQKAVVTVTAAPLSRNIYGNMPEVRYVFTGFANGENESNITINGLDTLMLTTDAANQRGTFDTAVTGNLSADNYTFVYQNSEITLTGLYYDEIAGIAVGGAAVLAITAFALVWFAIKKKTFADIGAGIKGVFVRTNTVTVTETVYVGKQALAFPDSFSQKEREIAADLISGMPRHEIAEKHFISQNTLLSHIQKIYKKTGCQSQVEFMAKYAQDKEVQ